MSGNGLFSHGNYLDTLPRMAVFAAVVREGGFSKAASALGVSKSNVSKQVTRLEEQLGVRLLSRTTRVVRPTEAGELYYERCVELLRLAQEAGNALGEIQQQPVGRVRISVPVDFGREFLAEPIADYLARFGRINAVVDVSDRQVDIVAEGFDLAIRVGAVSVADLVVRRLMETRRLVVASPAYLAAHGTPTRPEELTSHECLLYDYQASADRWVFRRDSRRVDVRVAGRVRSNNGDLLAAAACAGVGIAWLPDFVARRHLEAGTLVSVLDSDCREVSVVNAVLPARRHLPAKIRELLSVLEHHLAS